MSYALQNRIFAAGQDEVTIAAGAIATNSTITLSGIVSTDKVLLTLDVKGASASLDITTLPYVGVIIADTSIGLVMNVLNTSVVEQTIVINYVVIR